MKYKVLVTTSGTGSRLGELTKKTNKALVPINNKPTIEYIFSSYPIDITFVVTLGYLGQEVHDYLVSNYPNRKFEFVWVDKYVGDGSSLLYSMKCAKDKLQCPFIFHACDTIVVESVPEPQFDYVIGYVVERNNSKIDTRQYRSHKVDNGYLVKVNDKGVLDFDSIHIGMTGINNYVKFWETLEEIYSEDPMNQALGDVPIIERLLKDGMRIRWIPFQIWLDTGNLQAISQTENYIKKHTL